MGVYLNGIVYYSVTRILVTSSRVCLEMFSNISNRYAGVVKAVRNAICSFTTPPLLLHCYCELLPRLFILVFLSTSKQMGLHSDTTFVR
jgi:hypothetical protein